jgi:hypothetical protein
MWAFVATRDSFRHSEDRVVVFLQHPLGQFARVMHTSPMRIERNGAAERLTPRVERFLKECLGGVCQDEVQ